jgi:hypothetical protein
LDKEIVFCQKFADIFKTSIDKFVEKFDPQNPKEFLYSDSSEEEIKLSAAVQSMGNANLALCEYVKSHNPNNFLKLRVQLVESLIQARESVVKIHKDVFRSYRNFSILQELVQVFEEYNDIIIQEFFSDKKNVDKDKYVRVKQRIFALYDRLQVKYQGAESPSDQEAKNKETEKEPPKSHITVKERDPNAPKHKGGRPRTRTVTMEQRKVTIEDTTDQPMSEEDIQNAVKDIEKEQEERLAVEQSSATAKSPVEGATDAAEPHRTEEAVQTPMLDKIAPQESDILSLNPTKDRLPVINNPEIHQLDKELLPNV